MQLPTFFEGILNSLKGMPRKAYFIAIPVPLFLITVAVTLATSGGGDENPNLAVNPTVAPSLDNIDAPATATPTVQVLPTNTPVPTAAPPANREDCDAIRGTDYESPEEREWFLANCLGGGQTATTDTTGGSSPPAGDSGGGGGGAVASPQGQTYTGGGEFALGDRLVIPAIGLDAPVSGVVVPPSGAMPDPVGYFNAVWYDFSNFGGLGGYAGAGNAVLAGHVDSAVYGVAIFWYVRDLQPGHTIQYITSSGQVFNYTVVESASYSANADFTGFVSSGAADLTIITCTGSFSGGHYDSRHVVRAVLS